jgi:hypothetical protein
VCDRVLRGAPGGPARPVHSCDALRFLPALPPGLTINESSASAIITDPKTGQILAAVGETFRAQETPLIAAHRPGSTLDAFIYLTGFTRGLSPASLIWDIPGKTDIQNFDGEYHGPMRLRMAMANDYPAPAAQVLAQMGVENVNRISSSFGIARGRRVIAAGCGRRVRCVRPAGCVFRAGIWRRR